MIHIIHNADCRNKDPVQICPKQLPQQHAARLHIDHHHHHLIFPVFISSNVLLAGAKQPNKNHHRHLPGHKSRQWLGVTHATNHYYDHWVSWLRNKNFTPKIPWRSCQFLKVGTNSCQLEDIPGYIMLACANMLQHGKWKVKFEFDKRHAALPMLDCVAGYVRFQEGTCVFVLFGISRSSFAKFKE